MKRNDHAVGLPAADLNLHPVPFAVFDPREPEDSPTLAHLPEAGLANVASTTLELLGFAAPSDYLPSLLARDR